MAASPEQERQVRRPPPPPPPAAAVRLLDTTPVPVRPSSPPFERTTALPLTFFDICWLHAPPVQRVFFYRLTLGADVDAVISSLRDSLSRTLRTFFPLAGRLQLAPGTANRYEIHCSPCDAVNFTVAEYDDSDVDSLASDDAREVSKLAVLTPPLPEGGAVLAVQATVLPARRGLALGVTVHHAACDGAASTHFLRTWAAACSGSTQPPPPHPVTDRTLVPDPSGLYDAFCPKTAAPANAEEVESSVSLANDDKLLATFVLSRDKLQRVKDVVAAEAAARHGVAPPPRCSSLVATLGLIWSCYQRAKPDSSVGGGKTCLLFPVDHRSRMKPPIPDTYFGNCIGAGLAFASKRELAEAGAAGVWTACVAVASAVEEAVSGFGIESVYQWKDRVMEAFAMGILTVAGSPRFRVYELDFGFGRPAKVDVVSVARTGAISVAESRGAAGGMEVGVALPPDDMDAFRKCFADAVTWLDAGTQ